MHISYELMFMVLLAIISVNYHLISSAETKAKAAGNSVSQRRRALTEIALHLHTSAF